MAYTQEQLDAIKAAIGSPEQSVEVGGRKVVYKPTSELIKSKDDIAAELASASTPASGVRRGSYVVRFATARE